MISIKSGKLIAVTGGIGTGKSFVLDVFEKIGFEVFSADRAIHNMLLKDGAAYGKVASLFPTAVSEAGIDRNILGEIVFGNADKLKALEAILHPLVRQAQVDFVVQVKKGSGKSIVFEVPLLFENKRQASYDYVVVTTAPTEIQKERVLARKGMTDEKLSGIIAAQVDDKVRVKGAHFVIRTGKGKEDTIKQIKAIVKECNDKGNRSGHRNNRPLQQKR